MKPIPGKQQGYRHQRARERARTTVRSVAVRDSEPRRRWSLIELWMWAGIITSGALALLWLMLRTGTRPSRFAYPCQQAAFSTAAAAFGVPVVATLISCRRQLAARLRTTIGKSGSGAVIALVATMLVLASYDTNPDVTIMTPPAGYRPEVFLVNNARGIEPGRYGGVDDLITLMGAHGSKWHRSDTSSVTSGPGGMIDADGVVLIKINAQWEQRGGTNTDVLRGVIRRIVEHPDGFVGEIVVADNGQVRGSLDRTEHNAEDRSQSTQDVIDDFVVEGWDVSGLLWDTIRSISVAEYSDADDRSGYVVNPVVDAETGIRVSYPKFRSASGTYISYKYGVWSPTSQTYDPDKLVVINIPVFKTHFIYAITASVKNHMGVITTGLSTDSHNGVARGGLGSLLADVRMPDLNILDCIWILARPGSGPSASYLQATRRNQLLASTDPVALDMWATKYIMIPQIVENGFTYTDDPSQDPDNPQSKFRTYIDKTMNEMLLAGIETTNDYNAVRLRTWAGDVDRDGDLDLADFSEFEACISGPGQGIEEGCTVFDFNSDDGLDLRDLAGFQSTFTGS